MQFLNAWIPAGPPGTPALAALGTLRSSSARPLMIEDLTSTDFRAVELHRTVSKNGVARMMKLDNVTITPGESLELKRGGRHIMLVGPKRSLSAGDVVTLKVRASGGSYLFRIAIREQSPRAAP
ncbi:MAG: copper chaperone PCu(A)C [Polyangiaceae bacterium]|nr:copper chaperone PCu(A)C [Polyangiaceae bacterium]